MKDHQIAEIVNALRDAAVTHHASGQLRERLRGCIEPLLLAIAPPVAAVSVDRIETNEFCDLMTELQNVHERLGNCKPNWDTLIAHIHAWGAQQREAALAEQLAVFKKAGGSDQAEFNRKWTEQKERAEKAEARVKELEAGRQALQAEGKHPAPCASSCEARAFQNQVRERDAHIEELESQLVLRRAPLSPETQQAIAAGRAAGQSIAATSDGLVFMSDGAEPGSGELDCPACGGSGHAGAAAAGSAP